MADKNVKYVLEFLPQIPKKSLNKIFDTLDMIGNKWQKVMETRTMKYAKKAGKMLGKIGLAGAGVGGLAMAGASMAGNAIKQAGAEFEKIADEVEKVEIFAKASGGTVGQAERLTSLGRATGMSTEDMQGLFLAFQESVKQGKLGGFEANFQGFNQVLKQLSTIEGEKKTSLISDIFGVRKGVKGFELLQMNADELSKLNKELNTKTDKQIEAETSKITQGEAEIAKRREILRDKMITKFGGLSPEEIASAAMLEESERQAQIASTLSNMNGLMTTAQAEAELKRETDKAIKEFIASITPLLISVLPLVKTALDVLLKVMYAIAKFFKVKGLPDISTVATRDVATR